MIAKKITILLCDDIRQETGNKMSIMGLFGKTILCKTLPTFLRQLGIVVQLEKLKKNIEKIYISVKIPGDKDIKNPLIVKIPPPNTDELVSVAILLGGIKLTQHGKCVVELRESEKSEPFEKYEFYIREKEPEKTKE
jgi:hypothetical protein